MFSSTETTDVLPAPQHRRQPTSAAKGRVLIAAMAAGAAAAAAYTVVNRANRWTPAPCSPSSKTRWRARVQPRPGRATHFGETRHSCGRPRRGTRQGVAYAARRAAREARLQRPLFVIPTRASSPPASAIGGVPCTPASTWLRRSVPDLRRLGWRRHRRRTDRRLRGLGKDPPLRRHGDPLRPRQHLGRPNRPAGFAGDQIATVGNRGNSTGPHCHFEVLLGGTNRTDPVPWLAARGISVGPYAG